MHHLAITECSEHLQSKEVVPAHMCMQDLSLNPIAKGIFISWFNASLTSRGRVSKVIFHHKPTFHRQATLAQLGWQAVKQFPFSSSWVGCDSWPIFSGRDVMRFCPRFKVLNLTHLNSCFGRTSLCSCWYANAAGSEAILFPGSWKCCCNSHLNLWVSVN